MPSPGREHTDFGWLHSDIGRCILTLDVLPSAGRCILTLDVLPSAGRCILTLDVLPSAGGAPWC